MQREGKQVRADLIRLAFRLAGGGGEPPAGLIEFIELLHAGSLIIDDIEDNAATRRGRPALHRMYGVPVALNTGNWMYFAALQKLLDLPLAPPLRERMLRRSLAVIRRCHEGQALDLATRVNRLEKAVVPITVETITRRKTGGLVALAAWLGGSAAPADGGKCRALAAFGMQLGRGLQMQNDLVELKSGLDQGGRWDDLINLRATWPWAWAAQNRSVISYAHLRNCDSLQRLAVRLWDTAEHVGPPAIHRTLTGALTALEQRFGERSEIRLLAEMIAQLESSYV